jgi:hypothetical protein
MKVIKGLVGNKGTHVTLAFQKLSNFSTFAYGIILAELHF